MARKNNMYIVSCVNRHGTVIELGRCTSRIKAETLAKALRKVVDKGLEVFTSMNK